MSIYDKPVDRLTTADLEELLAAGAVENVRLEFKRELPGNDETLKKLSSFANTYGGYLVIGAEAASADGRLTALPGVEPQSNYKQTVIQRCALGISPLIQPFVSDAIPAPGSTGKVCYVVYSPESEVAPHFLNNRKGAYMYVRTDEYSMRYEPKLATAAELLHLFDRRRQAVDRRESLVRRAAARFQQLADAEYPPKTPGRLRDRRLPGGIGATMQIALLPRFPVAPLREQAEVMSLARRLHIGWRGVGFPNAYDPISQHESALLVTNSSAGFSLLEMNTWGLVFSATSVQDVWSPQGGGGQMSGIHLHSMLGHTLAVLEYARQAYDALGFMGSLEVVVAFQRVRGVPIFAFPDNAPEEVGVSHFDDEVRFALTVATDRLRGERDQVGADILLAALFALGWAGDGHGDTGAPLTSRLLDGAYGYNFWGERTTS